MSISRRDWLSGLAGAMVVGGFDPVSRTFVAAAHAHDGHRRGLPALDGELTFDPAALGEAARDFGGMVERAPWAVLRPGSVADVVAMVRFANRHGLAVAMRGQAHSTFGQAQAPAGVVIDSRTLATVHELGPGGALVDAGVTWRTLVTEATASGLSPRVLTDYLDLSIGGVLSVGGIGGTSHQFGFVADNVLELVVVTGEGEELTCSPTQHASLFRAVLGGLGQFALIVRARIALAPAQPLARVYQLAYADLGTFLRDQRQANEDERFDFLQGVATHSPDGSFQYVLQGARWFADGAPPDDASAVAGLSPLATDVADMPYVAWLARVDAVVEGLKASGLWTTPHPWSDLFLPDEIIEDFAGETLAALTPRELGPGLVLIYPFKRSRSRLPFLRLPRSETVWLFDLLRFVPDDPSLVRSLLADNRALLDRAVARGGKRYPISAVVPRPGDAPAHYEDAWLAILAAKARWDPARVLTPGQAIFRR